MSTKVDPVIQEFLERVRHKNTPEEKAKLYRQDWRWEVHLQVFAEHCQSIRQLLKATLTSDGWTWKQDEGYIGSDERTWRYRYKCITYEIGRKEFVFHICAMGRGYPARVVCISIEQVGHVRLRCMPGEDKFERNVDKIVEMMMIWVVSELTGERNEGYFK